VELSLDEARAALGAQPFSRLLGARITAFGPDRAELVVQTAPATASRTGSPTAACSTMRPTTRSPSPQAQWRGPAVLTAGYTINVLAPSSARSWWPGLVRSAPAGGCSSPVARSSSRARMGSGCVRSPSAPSSGPAHLDPPSRNRQLDKAAGILPGQALADPSKLCWASKQPDDLRRRVMGADDRSAETDPGGDLERVVAVRPLAAAP
jgi:hypothetical protein